MKKTILLVLFVLAASPAAAQQAVSAVRWLPMTPNEAAAVKDLAEGRIHPLPLPFTPYDTMRPKVPQRREVLADRNEYLADDPVGQFLIYIVGEKYDAPRAALKVDVLDIRGQAVVSQTLSPVQEPKVAFLLDMARLAPGAYRVVAALENAEGALPIQGCSFTKSAEKRRVLEFPQEGVPLIVHSQSHVPNGVYPITTGIPLPRHAAATINDFVLLENNQPVAAQLTQRATWYPNGEVKWMGMDFLARYDGGKPRDYRLVRRNSAAADSPLKVSESPDAFVVDTGAIQFKVGRRKFAGIEEVLLKGAGGQMKPVIQGAGGPFLMDERHFSYSAAADENAKVSVEEAGPVRVTLCARGWYTSNDRNERCCLYETRISAYAGQPWINVSHRTIITFDTDKKKLRELGFAVKVPGGKTWAFGGDGQVKSGDIPQPAVTDKKSRPVPAPSVWLHQDRWDHYRLMQGEDTAVAEGGKSDGWASIATPNGTVSLSMRNIWQMYPKELEIGNDQLNLHVWPRHGDEAFPKAVVLDPANLYKIFYAHQGRYLDLKFPQEYFDAMRKVAVAMEQQDINALAANGMGLATTVDFSLYFDPPQSDPARTAAWTKLYQQNPHAITEPVYNGLTEVEGRFAGKSDKLPELQRLLTEAYHGYSMSVDVLQDYGMWIWPDVHNNWSPIKREVEWHRWWQLSHYRGVWEGLFLYFRSGEPWIYEWACNNTRHYMDVGTVNYDDPGTPMPGKLTGAMFHCKGFLPWGSPLKGERCDDDFVEVGAHFINPDAHLFRYLLLGDRRGLELAQAWANAFGRAALPPERSRECNTTLGEMISYYENTWDPRAILYIRDLANDQNSRAWVEVPAFPGHAVFHDRWVMRYWNLTRDTMVQKRLLEWFTPDAGGWCGYPQLRALAWHWTGNKEYLTGFLQHAAEFWEHVYVNPQDPLNYFGGRDMFWPTHSYGQMLPYYMQALLDAGITAVPPRAFTGTPVARVSALPKEKSNIYWLQVGKDMRYGAKTAWLMPGGKDPVATIEITGPISSVGAGIAMPDGIGVSYLRIEDADGKVLTDGNMLYSSLRPSATVTLDARQGKGPWRLYKSGYDAVLKWTGPAQELLIGPTAEAVQAAAAGAK